ncbi:MAG: hypothetical protein HOL58_02625 [Francisellaceae bacterium]|nr:hypothetical protein [Francisellaceae bacterium]
MLVPKACKGIAENTIFNYAGPGLPTLQIPTLSDDIDFLYIPALQTEAQDIASSSMNPMFTAIHSAAPT